MVHYLTVQDVLWINLQLTKSQQDFDYATLEQCTYFQYGYGKNQDLAAQAASLLKGFSEQRPFERGSEATAFVAAATFLRINEKSLTIGEEELLSFMNALLSGEVPGGIYVSGYMEDNSKIAHDVDGTPDIADAANEIMGKYANALQKLLKEPAVPR